MNSTNSSYEVLYAEMEEVLAQIEQEALTPEMVPYQSMVAVRLYLVQLKAWVVGSGFSSPEEEIYFFKKVKPRFHCQFIYYAKQTRLLFQWPPTGKGRGETGLLLRKAQYLISVLPLRSDLPG